MGGSLFPSLNYAKNICRKLPTATDRRGDIYLLSLKCCFGIRQNDDVAARSSVLGNMGGADPVF